MEEQKTCELTDEALDSASGGAYYEFNEETGKYDVYQGNGTKLISLPSKAAAAQFAGSLNNEESLKRPSLNIPPFK